LTLLGTARRPEFVTTGSSDPRFRPLAA